jgi:hypothetical protein
MAAGLHSIKNLQNGTLFSVISLALSRALVMMPFANLETLFMASTWETTPTIL